MDAVTLAQLESQIDAGFSRLRFDPKIEARFCADYLAKRLRVVGLWAIFGLAVYNLVYFVDAAMVPDSLAETAFLRLYVFTPIALVCMAVALRWRHVHVYEPLTVAISVMGILVPMLAVANSTSPYLLIHQSFNTAVILFFIVALRPRFRAIVIGLVLMFAAQSVVVRQMVSFDATTYFGITIFYLILCVFLALSAYFFELADRQNFIHALHGQFLRAELQTHAERDRLTGLLNRHALARHEQAIWSGQQADQTVWALLLDIDNFKRFNDIYGHLQGDDCIRRVTASIADKVDPCALVFRFGGEEILVLAANTDRAAALNMAEAIRHGVEALHIPHGGNGGRDVTVSIGMAFATPRTKPLSTLLEEADAALYEAKRRGRNTVICADTEGKVADVA